MFFDGTWLKFTMKKICNGIEMLNVYNKTVYNWNE